MKPLDQSSAESLSTVAAAGDTAIKNLYTALEQVKTPISSEAFASAASRLDSDIEQSKDRRLFVADSGLGSSIGNIFVAAGAGATRDVGTILSSPAALLREDTDIPVDVVEAYRRVQLAKQLNTAPAESDLAIINQIHDPYNTANHPQLAQYGADYNPIQLLKYDAPSGSAQRFQSSTAPRAVPIVPADGVITPSTRTYAELLDMSAMGANWVRNVTKAADYSAYVDHTAPTKALDDFGKTYDEVAPELSAAVDKFTTEGASALDDVLVAASKASVAFAGTALSNVDTIPQLVSENAAQTLLAGNPLTGGFYAAGYGEQRTQEAIDALEKKQGSPATPQQKLDARTYANASALVETLSSVVTLGIGSGIKGIKGLKATAATLKTSEEVAEAVIKPNKALLFLKDTVAPVAGRTGTAALTEGTEEGIQKSLESKAAGQEATWREIVQDMGVGALAGGGMTMGRAGIDVTKNAGQSLAEATRNALKPKEEAPVVQPTPTVSDAQKARTEALNKIIQETPDLTTVTSVTDKADSMFHWASTADFTDQTTQDTAKKYLDDITKLTDVTQIGSGTTVYDQIANAPDEATKQKWTAVAESLDKAAARMTVKLNNDVRTPTERVQAAVTPQEKVQAYGSHDIQDFSNDDLKVMATWKDVPEHIQANVGKEIAIRSTMDEVSNNFTSGGKSSSLNAENLTGIEQHLTDFTHALRTGDKATAQSTLGVVANWAEKQNLKVTLLNEVIGALSVGDKAKVADLTEQMNTRIPRPKNGVWSFRSVRGAQKLLADAQVDAAKLNAGYKAMQELATGVDTGIKPTVEPTSTVTPVEPTTATTESVTPAEPTVESTNTVEPTTQTMTVSRTNKADGTYIVHSVVPHTSAKGKFVVSATSTESISGKPQKFVVDKSGQVYTKKRGAKVYTPQAGTTVSGVFEATQTNTTEEVTPTQTKETPVEQSTKTGTDTRTVGTTSWASLPSTLKTVTIGSVEIVTLITDNKYPIKQQIDAAYPKTSALRNKIFDKGWAKLKGLYLVNSTTNIEEAVKGLPKTIQQAAIDMYRAGSSGFAYNGFVVLFADHLNTGTTEENTAWASSTILHELSHVWIMDAVFQDAISGNPSDTFKMLKHAYAMAYEQYKADVAAGKPVHLSVDYIFKNADSVINGTPAQAAHGINELLAVGLTEQAAAAYLHGVKLTDNTLMQTVFDALRMLAAKILNIPSEDFNEFTALTAVNVATTKYGSFKTAKESEAAYTQLLTSGTTTEQTNTTEQPVSESVTQTEEVTPTQTDETVSEETTPEIEVDESIHWFKRAKERTVNILGEVVNRFANSFQLDTQHNRSLLAVVPDLMNRVTDPSWDYSHRLSNWNEVKYTAVWNDFSKFHDAVADSIQELIKGSAGKSETYAYQNPLAEFTQDVPPEMVTAIAAAMYDFLVTDARGTVFNSFKDMQFLNTTDKVETVPFDVYDALRHAGKPRFELEIAMGKAAFNALGMTTKGTAEQHSQGTFSNALGLIARQVLEDAGYLQATLIRDVLGNTSLPLEKSTTILYRAGDVGVDEQGETTVSLFNDIESLINNHKEDPTTIGNLFRLPSSQLFPATEVPKDKTKRFIGNTRWAVPAKVNELFNRKAKVAHEFNPTIIGYLDSIPNGMELLKLAAGYTKDTAQYIAGIKQTLDANNDQIERTIGLVGSFRQILKNKKTSKFYISNELWINHREGMQSAINPQTNKIIRNLITPIAWESTFTKTDTMPDFLVKAIGQSLGVNHENKSAQEFRLAVEQKLAEEPIQKALQAIAESKAADDTVRYLDTILAGVEAGGEHVHSLLGLLTYADYLATREGDKFTHRAYTEDDGKTSGVAISMVQLSRTLNMKVLNKFGLLTNDNYRSYADYKDLDAYQSLGMQLKDALENLPPIKALFGALVTEDAKPTPALRNLAKPLTMTPFYGSGMPGLMSAFLSEQVLPKIYIRLNGAKTLDDVNQVLDAYNYLLGSKRHRDVLKVQSFNPDSVLDTVLVYPNEAPGNTLLLRDFIVSSRTFTAMQELLTDILREDIVGKEGVLNTTYGPQLEAQRKYGELVTAMGVMYQELRQRKIDAILEERANQAGIPVEKYKTAHTLTIAELAAVDKELLEVTPAIKSAMFSSKDELNAQVPLTEQDVVMGSIDINSPYRSQLMVKGKGVKSVAGEVVVTPRQTGAVAISTHSTDGSTIFSTGLNVSNGETAWGIHDATAGGENIADAMTKGMNQHFREIVVQKYSYMAEGLATFERIAAEYTKVTGEKEISIGKDNIVLSAMAKEFHQLVTDIKTNQQEIDKAVHTYDQYVGTPYEAHPRANQQQVLGNIGNTATGTVRSPDALGSHAASNNSQNFTEHLDITPATSEAVFDQLANPSGKQDSTAHTAHLRSVLVNALNKGLKQVQVHIAQSIGYTSYGRIQGTDMYIVNAQYGPNRYAKQNFGSLVVSTQEVYVHELVHGIAAWAVDNNPAVRAELKRMWKAAQAFARHPKNRALYNQHKEMFDRVFDPKFVNGKADYLQEFLAYANTNADMIALLKQVSLPALKSRWFAGDNLFEKATSFFSTLVDMLRGRVLHLKSDQVDVRMGELLRHIATIDSTHRGLAMALAQRFRGPLDGLYEISNTSLKTGLDRLYKATRKGGRVGRAVSAVLLPAQVVLNQPNNPALKFIKAAGKRFEHYMTESENAGLREVAALVREGRSRNKKNSAIVEAISSNKTAGDRARQTLNTNTVTALRSSFDPNVTWEPKHYAALTYVLARSGFEYLLGMTPNLGSALNLITNNARRQSEITRVSAELDAAVNNDAFYRLQAQNLAWLTVDGQGVGLSLPRYSPYAIAQGRSGTETVDPKVEKLVQQLTALYALNYLTAETRNTAVEVIRHEMNRRDSYGVPVEFNGITTLLGNIASLRKDAEHKLFNGTKGLMQFGYIGDTFAAQMDVQYSTDSADPDLLAKGYTQEGVLRGDRVVPNVVPKYIYVNRTGGLAKLDTGAFLLDSKRSRGTDVTPPVGMTMNTMVNIMMRTKVWEDDQTYNRGTLVINSNAAQNAVPRWDTQGNVLGFRYLMGEKLKDTLLQREMDITKVLGNLTASTYIKANVRELNQVALAAVKQMYDTQYQDNPEDFVLIGPRAAREEDRAAWAILPYETKADALKLFGSKDGFYVRRDSRALNFGQRSYSLRNIWDKTAADRNLVEKAVHTVATRFFGNEAANKLVVANDFFVTLATIAKDFIVIKSFIVTLSNTVSNMLLNKVNGIGALEQIKAMTTAYTEAVAYQKAEARLTQLNVLLASTSLTGPTRTRYEEERVILQEDMRVNVVGEMIRAGALQSIEDITKDAEKGLYDLIPGAKTISDTYGKIVKSGSWGDTLIRNGLIMQNSALYKQLRIAAQMSDFVSKYAYVQNRVNRKNNPLSLKQAISEASELFIEYNLPSGVFTQALNDIGLLMFTKYLIRVQKTILTTTLNYPIRTLMMVLMTDWLNVPSSIMSSFMDNPLQRMAFPGLSLLKAADEGLGTRILSTVY